MAGHKSLHFFFQKGFSRSLSAPRASPKTIRVGFASKEPLSNWNDLSLCAHSNCLPKIHLSLSLTHKSAVGVANYSGSINAVIVLFFRVFEWKLNDIRKKYCILIGNANWMNQFKWNKGIYYSRTFVKKIVYQNWTAILLTEEITKWVLWAH